MSIFSNTWHNLTFLAFYLEGDALLTIIRDAGWPIWPLLAASILSLAFIIERSVSLRRKRVLPPQLTNEVLTVLRSGDVTSDTIKRLRAHSPLGEILAVGVEQITQNTAQEAAASMQEMGKHVGHELERYLSALGTIASIAPLLGLFGTVVGMIEIFASQDSNGTPAALAHGISVALYNTAFGLIIAIPTLVFWRTFRRHVDELLVELERQAAYFLKCATELYRS